MEANEKIDIMIGSRYHELGQISHKIKILKQKAQILQNEISRLEVEGHL